MHTVWDPSAVKVKKIKSSIAGEWGDVCSTGRGETRGHAGGGSDEPPHTKHAGGEPSDGGGDADDSDDHGSSSNESSLTEAEEEPISIVPVVGDRVDPAPDEALDDDEALDQVEVADDMEFLEGLHMDMHDPFPPAVEPRPDTDDAEPMRGQVRGGS